MSPVRSVTIEKLPAGPMGLESVEVQVEFGADTSYYRVVQDYYRVGEPPVEWLAEKIANALVHDARRQIAEAVRRYAPVVAKGERVRVSR